MLFIVKVKIYGHLKNSIGLDQVSVDINGRVRLTEFLKMLKDMHPRLSIAIAEELFQDYLMLINGVDVRVYDDINEIYIENSDEIAIIPITHGGAESA